MRWLNRLRVRQLRKSLLSMEKRRYLAEQQGNHDGAHDQHCRILETQSKIVHLERRIQ